MNVKKTQQAPTKTPTRERPRVRTNVKAGGYATWTTESPYCGIWGQCGGSNG